jgi:ELWxxDGT repeat protein
LVTVVKGRLHHAGEVVQRLIGLAVLAAALLNVTPAQANAGLHVAPTAQADSAGCHGLDVWNGDVIINTIPPVDGIGAGAGCAVNTWSTLLPGGRLIFDWNMTETGVSPNPDADVYGSDGTPGGLRKIATYDESRCSTPNAPKVVVGTAYLRRNCAAWDYVAATRGTKTSTFQLPGWNLGPLVRTGNRVVYSALGPKLGRELYVSDGARSGSHLLKDIWPGKPSSGIASLHSNGTIATFTADDGHGRANWVTDGTVKGTHKVSG